MYRFVDIDGRGPAVYVERVSHIHQDVRLSAERAKNVRMLVDTGATFSIVPEAIARAIGVKPMRQRRSVMLADGRRIKLAPATAIFKIGDREAPATILVGQVAEPILGVETLEALGLAVDPRRERLIPTRSYTLRA